MSRPIKETPILRGKDAKAFLEDRKHPKAVSSEVKKRIFDNFKKLQAIFIETPSTKKQ